MRLVQADHRGEGLGRRPQAPRQHLDDRAAGAREGDLRVLVREAVRLLEHRHHGGIRIARLAMVSRSRGWGSVASARATIGPTGARVPGSPAAGRFLVICPVSAK
ncbi:hypothetical protein [Methylobacterium sp. 17Sr1-1]|uniref:hypothetical protein n=1 Tax=Methylobacterium sp. 17Sr1-1 TaxID=2202826 RepID=UPI001FDF1AE3